MRKTKALVAFAFAMLVMPMVMGASLTMDLTPNPGGAKNMLKGHGTWALKKGEKFESICFHTTVKDSTPVQVIFADAKMAGTKWSSTLLIPAASYTPTKATLHFRDAANKPQSVTVNVNIDQVVK